uniref:DUF4283 domain-containing protein n=1 Tax=Nicotiana tabacum TaxID=4097 RepID=A0A1S3XMC5_TOBAC|nr:PREDICTED: uncharacterized protein LOC107766790 [Nicotiana tabacum]
MAKRQKQPTTEIETTAEEECNSEKQWNSTDLAEEKENHKCKGQKPTIPRRLQFSEAGSSAQPFPNLEQYAAIANGGNKLKQHAKELRQQNRNSQMGMRLDYVPPIHRDGKIVVQIVEEDVRELNDHWATALIGYVLGDTPYEKSMEAYIASVWDFVPKPQILYHSDGYYVFIFSTIEDRDLVMQAGPYSYHNKPFILQNWEREFHFDPKCITTIPLWLHFPSLPVGYWTADALSKVASAIGTPMYTGRYTADLNKISYARVLVKVDITKPILESIEIDTPSGTIQQEILYEWKPKFCSECIYFGHDSFECWRNKHQNNEEAEFKAPKRRNRVRKKKIVQEWKPKEQQEQEGKVDGKEEENQQVEAGKGKQKAVAEDAPIQVTSRNEDCRIQHSHRVAF